MFVVLALRIPQFLGTWRSKGGVKWSLMPTSTFDAL